MSSARAERLTELLQDVRLRQKTPATLRDQYAKLLLGQKQKSSTVLRLKPDCLPLMLQIGEDLGIEDSVLQELAPEPLKDLRRKLRVAVQVGRDKRTLSGIDIVSPPKLYCLPECDILDPSAFKIGSSNGNGLVRLPGQIFLSLAVSTVGLERGRGMLLWQHKNGALQAPRLWHHVPDLLFYPCCWTERDQRVFRNMSMEEKRDFLNADTMLRNHDIALPCTVDFPDGPLRDARDARIDGELDSSLPPLVAISIPNQAFVGWVPEMLPNCKEMGRSYYRKSTRSSEPNQYVVPEQGKLRTKIDNVSELYDRLLSMWADPMEGAVIYYQLAIDRKMKALKEGGGTVTMDDEQEAPEAGAEDIIIDVD